MDVSFWQFLLTLLLGLFVGSLLPAYFSKKGENLATKEDVEAITKKVEAVRVEYASRQHKSQIAFEKEFEILSELWEALFDLQKATLNLRQFFEIYDPSKPEYQIEQERLNLFSESYTAYVKIVMKRQPFYPKNIFEALDEIRFLAADEKEGYTTKDIQSPDNYWDDAEKNQEAIIKSIDKVGKLIRERYSD